MTKRSKHSSAYSAKGLLVSGFLFVAVLVGGFGGWASLARIDGAVVSSGQVVVEQNRQEVAHRDGGVVQRLLVAEGSEVARGETIMVLSADELENDIEILRVQLFELAARSARLEAERDGTQTIAYTEALLAAANTDSGIAALVAGQDELHAARNLTQDKKREQLDKQKAQVDAQLGGLAAQKTAIEEQHALARADLEDQIALREKGLTQQGRVTQLRREVAGLIGDLGRLEAAVAQAHAQITEIELEVLKLDSDRREAAIAELRDLQSEMARVREQSAALENRRARLEIVAPVAGTVYDLAVFGEGAVVSPAEPLLFIVPQDRPLVIAARINPVHVDQVYPGQSVRLRFTTFDQRTTPELLGVLRQLSADAFVDEPSGTQYYSAEITLPEDQRARLPDGAVLIPGMPVEAFMSTGERTPLAYLTRPLTDYFTRAFRE